MALLPASVLVGQVRAQADGAPIAGVSVVATSVRGPEVGRWVTRSDEAGNFRLEGIAAGHYQLEARAATWRSKRYWASVGVGETSTLLSISVSPATVLSVAVQVGGEPCPFGSLDIAGPASSAETSDSHGKVLVEGLLPGHYHVSISCPNVPHEPSAEDLEIDKHALSRVWNLERAQTPSAPRETAASPPATSAKIRVLVAGVSNPNDAPPSVLIAPQWGGEPIRGKRVGRAFHFEGIGLGKYVAYLEASPSTSQLVDVARDGQELEASLEPPPHIELAGRLIDQRGAGVAGALVQATTEPTSTLASATASAVTDNDGSFEFEALFSARYNLRAEGNLARSNTVIVERAARGITLQLHDLASLSGNVRDASGGTGFFSLLCRRAGETETLQSGGFDSWALPWIEPGAYQIVVRSPLGVAYREINAEARKATDVSIIVGTFPTYPLPAWALENLQQL